MESNSTQDHWEKPLGAALREVTPKNTTEAILPKQVVSFIKRTRTVRPLNNQEIIAFFKEESIGAE